MRNGGPPISWPPDRLRTSSLAPPSTAQGYQESTRLQPVSLLPSLVEVPGLLLLVTVSRCLGQRQQDRCWAECPPGGGMTLKKAHDSYFLLPFSCRAHPPLPLSPVSPSPANQSGPGQCLDQQCPRPTLLFQGCGSSLPSQGAGQCAPCPCTSRRDPGFCCPHGVSGSCAPADGTPSPGQPGRREG